MTEPVMNVISLTKEYSSKRGLFSGGNDRFKAVDTISFSIQKGETFGLVGESGCGKSTTGRMLVRLEDPTSGEIWFKGQNITAKNGKQLLPFRRHLQMIFQNPYGSLDPKMTLRQIIEEPIKIHKLDIGNKNRRVRQLLDHVGLSSVLLNRYPAEFSGGQRQRIAIARALALNPEFIVADEPVSALDVSIQAQILNLMIDLQNEFSLTTLFISHDLSVVQYISNRAGVMYQGRIVELSGCEGLYRQPLHPYTKTLLACIPIPDPDRRSQSLPETTASLHPATRQKGCRFYLRCGERMEICLHESPELKEVSPGHSVACHLYRQERGIRERSDLPGEISENCH